MIPLQILFVTCFIAAVVFFISFYKKKGRFFELGNKLPGPKSYPLIGNLLDFISVDYDILQVLQVMSKFDGIARFWLGSELTVAITDPEYLEVLYNSNDLLARPDQYKPIEHWVGEGGLVTAGGEQWKKARRIMIQSFHSINPQYIATTITTKADDMVHLLRSHVGKGFFEASPIIRRNGCGIIIQVGIDEDSRHCTELLDALHGIEELTKISVLRFLSPLHYFDVTFSLTQDGRNFKRLQEKLRNVMTKIVISKRKQYERMKQRGDKPPDEIFIYNLFEKHGDESIEDLTTHLITLMASAIDTSSDTIGFVLLMAAIYPDVQEKLYEEDKSIQRRITSGALGPSELQHYHYLDRVVKETLRLYPGFPMTGRSSTEEVQLGKYLIPKGTNVLALNFWTNRRKDIFYDPLKFNTDRFLPENAKKIHPYAFLPFGSGLRNCAGTKYALLTIKIEVIKLIRAFKIRSEYKSQAHLEMNLFADIVLRDKNNVRLLIEER